MTSDARKADNAEQVDEFAHPDPVIYCSWCEHYHRSGTCPVDLCECEAI